MFLLSAKWIRLCWEQARKNSLQVPGRKTDGPLPLRLIDNNKKTQCVVLLIAFAIY
jgi:hypothetical protein